MSYSRVENLISGSPNKSVGEGCLWLKKCFKTKLLGRRLLGTPEYEACRLKTQGQIFNFFGI